MDERADYYIEKVRYNKDHTRIVWVSVREDSGKRLSGAYNMVRRRMVNLIREGKQFMTIYRNPAGKYRRGKRLTMTTVKGGDFLRTNPGEDEKDELEDLPEY